MSFLGTSYCKFISGSNTVLLENSLVSPSWQVPDELEHTSIFSGFRNYITKGDYVEVNVTVFLNKYSNSKLNELLQYKDKLVEFYPFVDGDKIMDVAGDTVYLYLSDVEPFYLEQTTLYDGVKLKFTSNKYHYLGEIDTDNLHYGYLYGTRYGSRL